MGGGGPVADGPINSLSNTNIDVFQTRRCELAILIINTLLDSL